MVSTLIVPGLKSSGPAHWQSWFEERIPGSIRVIQTDWHRADLADWWARVRRDISRTPGRLFIVAHSFGVLAAVQAAFDHSDRIAGALLVAPADPDTFAVADVLPQGPLPFASVVVGSNNDTWMTLERAAHWADVWGSEFVNLGAAGHINAEAGFGPWPEGLALLERLRRASDVRRSNAGFDPAITAFARRHGRRAGTGSRSVPRPGSAAVKNHNLLRAAALLEDAGWQVLPPSIGEYVTSA